MLKLIAGLLLALGMIVLHAEGAHASRLDKGAGTKFYLNESGKQINAIEADKDTTNDLKVFQCQPVEKVCNEKTGKCAIKAVK